MREVFPLLVLAAVLLPLSGIAKANCAGRELSLPAALDLAAQYNADLLLACAKLAADKESAKAQGTNQVRAI